MPCPEVKSVGNRMVLQSGHVGDINSMFWMEAPDVENSKLKVVVSHFIFQWLLIFKEK